MGNQAFYDRIFPPTFWTDMDRSRFVVDDQSMFAEPDVFEWIIMTVKPDTIVELGSWKGHSANFMADCCKSKGLTNTRIICVDTFLGGPEHWILGDVIDTMRRRNGMPTILDAFLGNTVARGNEGMIFPLTVDTTAGWQIMRDLNFTSDVIYVDAGHAYDQVCGEIEGYLPRLTQRGVMFGDDYQAPEVARAVHDMAQKHGFQVAVIGNRKWIFVTEALLGYLMPNSVQIKTL